MDINWWIPINFGIKTTRTLVYSVKSVHTWTIITNTVWYFARAVGWAWLALTVKLINDKNCILIDTRTFWIDACWAVNTLCTFIKNCIVLTNVSTITIRVNATFFAIFWAFYTSEMHWMVQLKKHDVKWKRTL